MDYLKRMLSKLQHKQLETATEDDIRMMMDLGSENGIIKEEENEWIQNVFEFNDITADLVMTRQPQIIAFSIDTSKEGIIKTIRESGLSRYPVYGEDINDILGILYAKDYLLELTNEHQRDLKELLRPAYFVPDSIHADKLFRDMRKNKQHIAIVINEYGETCGIVTMEDLLEEIVGNIYDEFDPAEQLEIESVGENTWKVSGSILIKDLADELGIELTENEDYDTLGGMILNSLGYIPEDGTKPHITIDRLEIHVIKVNKRRIEQAIVKLLPQQKPVDSEE